MTPAQNNRNLDPLRVLLQDTMQPEIDLYMVLLGIRDALLEYRKATYKDSDYLRSYDAIEAAGLRGLCRQTAHPISPMCALIGCDDGSHSLEEIAAK